MLNFTRSHYLVLKLLLLFILCSASVAEARTRTFCKVFGVAGVDRPCGKHLEPQCTSGSACDSGYSSWTIDYTVNCPSPVADQTVTAGCYDRNNLPTCQDCGGHGQPPCPSGVGCTVGCDSGAKLNKFSGLCSTDGSWGIPPGKIGASCSTATPCESGLTCNGPLGKCVANAGAKQSCANPFVGCEDNLVCTLALECAHQPARLQETCDVTNPCAEGYFCQPGIPQRCVKRRTLGEGCSAVNPCEDGYSCEACFTQGCNAPFQCFLNNNEGVITEQQCRKLYSPAISRSIQKSAVPFAHTYGTGGSSVAAVGLGKEIGVVYGKQGGFGCYESTCLIGGLALGAGVYGNVGLFESVESVGGQSFNIWGEVGFFKLLSYNYAHAMAGEPTVNENNEILYVTPVEPADSIGNIYAFGVGLPSPMPAGGGVAMCTTTLDIIYSENEESKPAPEITSNSQPKSAAQTQFDYGSGALWFDAESKKAGITNSSVLNALTFTEDFSVSLWIFPTKAMQSGTFLSKEGEYQIALLGDRGLSFTIANSNPGWAWESSDYHPPINQWTQIALTHKITNATSKQSVITLYANGKVIFEIDSSGVIGDRHPEFAQFQIGGRQLNNDYSFHGKIDDLAVWDTALSAQQMLQTLDSPAKVTNNLIAHWDFDEIDNNIAIAKPNEQLNIQLNEFGETATPSTSLGKQSIPSAAYFDGNSVVSSIQQNPLNALAGSAAFTLEAWVYSIETSNEEQHIAELPDSFVLGITANNELFFNLAGEANDVPLDNNTILSGSIISVNQWQHVALVYDANQSLMNIFLNGQLINSMSANGALSVSNSNENYLILGENFKGSIDEFRVWSSARSVEQIQQYFDRTVTSEESTLQLAWSFDVTQQIVINDYSGNNQHGILGNATERRQAQLVSVENFTSYPEELSLVSCNSLSPDKDGDGICDAIDNCPSVENAEQIDSDGDELGDACSHVDAATLTSINNKSAAETTSSSEQNVMALDFELSNEYAGHRLKTLRFSVQKVATTRSISALYLWHDSNNNGVIDSDDQSLNDGQFELSNGELVLSIDQFYSLPIGSSRYLVSVELSE